MEQIIREQVGSWIPRREINTYKNKMGHILCVGGNENMGGAIMLSAASALHAGAGLVTVATAPENRSALHSRTPEAMFVNFYKKNALIESIKKADVIILGPGLGLSEKAEYIFEIVLETVKSSQWLILDGDALTLLSQTTLELPKSHLVLTPHLGEWKRLTDIETPADNQTENQKWRNKLNAIVILKKNRSEVYFAEDVWQNTTGNPSMATGGMGDTLTGIVASFLGQFEDKKAAILSGVYVHSAAADELSETHYVTLPTTLIDYFPIFIKNLKS